MSEKDSGQTADKTFSRVTLWLRLARLPFHSVGILPFLLGAVMAWSYEGTVRIDVLIIGSIAVVFIMLATYLAGECFDLEEDTLAAASGKSKFSAGSQVLVKKLVPREHVFRASVVSLIAAAILGLILTFVYRTGFLTIPLGLTGMICGFFYSTPPLRWVKRGIGELMIGFCYGPLAVAASFYLMTGKITSAVGWASLPIALTIFNVILINEFPDYEADRLSGKNNLVVRLGKEKAAVIYLISAAIYWFSLVLSVKKINLLPQTYFLQLPILLVSAVTVVLILRKKFRDRASLEKICALTLITNLGTSLVLILAIFFFRK